MVNIKTMDPSEIKHALVLTERENWGYCEDDFKRMLNYEPRGCFIAMKSGKVIGLTTTINYGVLGWIGNVVVDEKYRNEGIGKQLVVHALGYLKSAGVRCIKLFSYLDVREFYLRLGFKEEGNCPVFTNAGLLDKTNLLGGKGDKTRIKRIESRDLKGIKSMDRRLCGYDRSKLLERLANEFPRLCHCISNLEPKGYILASNSQQIGEVGPWVCDPSVGREDAESLLRASLSSMKAQKIEIVVPDGNKLAAEILKDLKFEPEYEVATMGFGESVELAEPEGIFAFCSLAQG